MKIHLLSITSGRPVAIPLLEKCVRSFDYPSYSWVIVCDNDTGYIRPENATWVQREKKEGENHSFCENLLCGMELINLYEADICLFLEDDEFYRSDYLSTMLQLLMSYEMVGLTPSYYYHVGQMRYRPLHNTDFATLAATGIRRSLFPAVIHLAKLGCPYNIDIELWRGAYNKNLAKNDFANVSLKGMRGATQGVGRGHSFPSNWGRDSNGTIIQKWIPKRFPEYLKAR